MRSRSACGSGGVDVLTSQEDGTRELADPALLDRATALSRVLFSQDDDLLREAQQRQQNGVAFGGMIYAPLARRHHWSVH